MTLSFADEAALRLSKRQWSVRWYQPPRSQLEQQLIDAQYRAGGNNMVRSNDRRLSLHGLFPSKASSTPPPRGTISRRTPTRRPKALGSRHRSRRRRAALVSSLAGTPLPPADATTYIRRTDARSQQSRQGRPAFLCTRVLTTLHRRVDLTLDIRVGDLVIVETDRGLKDPGHGCE